MTIGELRDKLAGYPQDLPVIIDNSRDFEDFEEVGGIAIGKYTCGMCGGSFVRNSTECNAVLIV